LTQRLQALEAERQGIERQLADVNAFLDAADRYASISPESDDAPAVVTRPALRETTGKRPRNPRREDVLELVVEELLRAGRPMQLRELYDVVTAKGIVLNGADPVGVLGTMLWRGGQEGTLVNLKGVGYWPADSDYEPAGYEARKD
jgi:hypothetical protein